MDSWSRILRNATGLMPSGCDFLRVLPLCVMDWVKRLILVKPPTSIAALIAIAGAKNGKPITIAGKPPLSFRGLGVA
jgi:hypothetical protein